MVKGELEDTELELEREGSRPPSCLFLRRP